MKANITYTAKDILQSQGIDVESIGKMRVRIGGIAVFTPDQLIRVPQNPEGKLNIIIGNEKREVEIEANDEVGATEEAQKVIEADGRQASKDSEMLTEAKKATEAKINKLVEASDAETMAGLLEIESEAVATLDKGELRSKLYPKILEKELEARKPVEEVSKPEDQVDKKEN